MRTSLLWFGATFLLSTVATLIRAQEPKLDFNRDIRPILAENCFYCHGQDSNKREAGLRLDILDEAVSGGAIDLTNPNQSSLLVRIHSDDPDSLMPPPKSNRSLTAAQKETLKLWVQQGAPYSQHWAFVAPTKPSLPKTNTSGWTKNAIDQFVLSQLERAGLSPSPEADRVTLIKRLHADLIGLPPTPEEVEQFVSDPDPQAYEKLVDRLMQSEHYGERMALPWLDAARYADSNGFQQDGDTWQWMWRDWVVTALNRNLPFDQFVVWQLAGDLLPDATLEQKIASGFNRNHLLNGEGGAIAEEQRFVILFDRMDTTATTFLGLTMSCAQCHDHKYDPITQKDYYSLMDAFNRVPESGVPQYLSSRIRVAGPYLEVPSDEVKAKTAEFDGKISELEKVVAPLVNAAYVGWKSGLLADQKAEDKGLPVAIVDLLKKPEKERNDDEKKRLDEELRKHFDQNVRDTFHGQIAPLGELAGVRASKGAYLNDQMPRPMIMSDSQKRDTHILTRGEYLKPADKVEFATPAFLPPLPDDYPKNRLGFARWLMTPEQPLMSRVQVNRIWQYYFGTGFVKTSEDFGVQSEYPIHMDLLDWLSVEFRESGWDTKAFHRMILTSATYRQTSRFTEVLLQKDPENRLFGRSSRMRMPAMILRDWALGASRSLDQRVGGKPVYPYQPDAIWESLAITKERDFTYPASTGVDLYRRSLYTFWRRTVGPANMFDSSNRQTCKVRLSTTSTPLHALTTLNDPTWVEAARLLAEKSLTEHAEFREQLDSAFRRVLCRKPTEREIDRLVSAFEKQKAIFVANPNAASDLLAVGQAPRQQSLDVAHHAAFTAVCLAILNLDEALTRE